MQSIIEIIKDSDYPKRSQRCYLYNNYYEKTERTIKFIHKSFYEFFLAEYIGNMLQQLCVGDLESKKKYERLSNFLAYNKIDDEVFQHLRNKIRQVDYGLVDFLSAYLNGVCIYGGCFFVTQNDNSILKSEAYLFYNLLKIVNVVEGIVETKFEVISEDLLWDELANIEQIGLLEAHLLDGIVFENLLKYSSYYRLFGEDRMKASMIDTRHRLWMNTVFSGMVFCNSDLSESYFLGTRIEMCRFEGMQLHDCDFRYSRLLKSQFVNGVLRDSDFSNSVIDDVQFRGVDLSGVKFENCEFQMVVFDSDNIKSVEQYITDGQENIKVYIRKTRETVSYARYITSMRGGQTEN